jgi:DNA-binding transcriptional ArsR family regulator
LSVGVEVVQTLADCLRAIGNVKRLEIIQYCLQPRTFTEIVINLKLNPASFKFHSRVLTDCNLLRKIERGKYETTELGKLLLELVGQASVIAVS